MKMNKFETFACDQIFHSYPIDKTYEEIKALCLDDEARDTFNDSLEDSGNECDQIDICERYENEWWDNIPILLDELRDSSQYHFGENKND